MPSDQDIELAHPEAFDFVFGNLPPDATEEFNRHLDGCRYCQTIVADYSDIGRIVQSLPPHVEPPADLEDRTVAAVLLAMAGQPIAIAGEPTKADQPSSGAEDLAATRTYQVPQAPPPAAGDPAPGVAEASATVTPLPLWRRHRSRLASAWVAAAAAIVLLAIIVIPRLGGGGTVLVSSMHATSAAQARGDGAATATATARQNGESWTFQMTAHGLKPLPGDDFYECWYVGAGNTFASGGTFVVDKSGSATVPMTTGVDPRQFPTMVITAEAPGDGALHRPFLLIGRTTA
ncbi:MAG: anti-sigma factor [Streptosporangiaceae bacterium]|jgi:hypothetical protein